MKSHTLAATAVCTLSALALSLSSAYAAPTQISALFMTQAAYSENDIRAMTADFSKQHPDITVNLEFVPYEALHDKIVAARGAGSNGYDVVLFDAIWPAEFTKFGLLQDVTARISADDSAKIFAGAMTTVTYKDKRWGMPWILDTKYLYYNKAMLAKAGIAAPAENLAGAGTAGGNSEAEKRGQVPAGVELVTGRSAGLRLHHAGVGLQGPVHPAGQNHLLQPGFAAGRQLHESVTG